MQLSEKEKQALQEKIKEQRQAMWSGKQSASQDAEDTAADEDQDVNPSGDPAKPPAGSEVIPLVQPDSSSTPDDPPAPTETTHEETPSNQSSVQPEVNSEGEASHSFTQNGGNWQKASQSPDETEASSPEPEAAPVVGNTDAPEEDQQATQGDRVFWETLEQEGGSSILNWKIVIAVIGVAVILVGVGVYLGFLFAG